MLADGVGKSLIERENLHGRIAELEGQLSAARAEDRHHQTLIRTLESQAKMARHELNSVYNELKALKAKYHSTQDVLKRERGRLKAARKDLAKAEAVLARYRRSVPWRIYMIAGHGVAKLKAVCQRFIGGSRRRRRERALNLLEQSSLFDRDWYLETYPDVATSGIDPALHYLETGWREGRDAGPAFSTSAYLRANADVAAHGLNPLLHYVEYGHFEGRGAPKQAAPKLQGKPQRLQFDAAAPCASFPAPEETVVRWARAGKIDDQGFKALRASDRIIGFFPDNVTRKGVQEALLTLRGHRPEIRATQSSNCDDVSGSPALLDAWYVNRNALRTRWKPQGEPIVIRALQQTGESPVLVGESLVCGQMDLFDLRLINPFFPLLFVFCANDGAILGWRLIVFPSLCRGGLHYPELVLLAQRGSGADKALDPCRHSSILATQLHALMSGERRLIATIDVDLTAADASSPLFQPDFQHWLRDIVGVCVKAADQVTADDREQYLAVAAKVSPQGFVSERVGTLFLGADMYPSISALVSGSDGGMEAGQSQLVPLIAVSADVSQPAILIHLPAHDVQDADLGLGRKLPILESVGSPDDLPVAALRSRPSQQLRDAELLVPVAAPMLDFPKSELGTTWIFWPSAWIKEALVQSLMSIAAQIGAGPHSIAFVGSDDAAAVAASAEQLFPGRVRSYLTVAEAALAIDTPLAAYVGPNIILHDQRTARALSAMLNEPGTISSSVVLTSIVQRGRNWSAAVCDAGTIPTLSGLERSSESQSKDALLLWRGSWSTMKPPRDLWMIRAATLQAWLTTKGTAVSGGRHVCSSLLTASYSSPPEIGEAPLSPPANPATSALRSETLAG